MTVSHERRPMPSDVREPREPVVFNWRKGLALLLAAAGLWLLSVTATTIFLDLFGRP